MAENIRPGVTKKEGTINENGLVVQNIHIRPVVRTKQDILNWRNAHQQAEGIQGSRIALYDLYSDVLLDGFLKRLVAKRVLSVTKNKLKYIDGAGKEIEVSKTLLRKRQFRKLRQSIQLYKAWGISVVELINDKGELKIFDVPRKHIVPTEGKIVFEQYGVDGIPYRELPYSKTVIEVGDWDDLGYLLEACAYAIYKRGNIADWANYAQIFGMPFREYRYDGFNEGVRLQLEMAAEKAASAAWAVLPKEADFVLHKDSGTSGSTTLYDTLRTAMNQEMMVLILGATETTTSSSSSGYAQSQTHAQTVDEVQEDDQKDELAILNEQVLPVLITLGLLPPGGSFVYDKPQDLERSSKQVEIALKMKDKGIPVSDDYFYEVSGVPKPDNYDQLKKDIEDAKVQNTPAPGGKGPAGKPVAKPAAPADKKKMSQVRKLMAAVEDFFGPAH